MPVNVRRRSRPVRGKASPGRDVEATQGNRERERIALLRAARRVFLRRGYAETRVEDVLREAGLSTRAFYRVHASKDELFLALFDRANAAAMARLRASVARHSRPVAQLDAYVDATLDLAHDPRLAAETRLFAGVPPGIADRHAEEVLACREQLVAVLREIIERGGRSGDFPHPAPAIDAWALHGALSAALELALRSPRSPGRAALSRRLRRLLRGALGAA